MIQLLYKDKYKHPLSDVRQMQNEIARKEGKSACIVDFEQQLTRVYNVFQKHSFDMNRYSDLKTREIYSQLKGRKVF